MFWLPHRTVQLTVDPDDNALRLLRRHATSAGASRSASRNRAMLPVRLNQLGTSDLAASATTALALTGEVRTSARPGALRFGASDEGSGN